MIDMKYYETLEDFINDNKNSKSRFFLLIAEETIFDINTLINFDVSGAIVPQIIMNNENCSKGLLVSELGVNFNIDLVEDLSKFTSQDESFKNKDSLIVILDGLSPNISSFLDNLFESISHKTQIIGGGAGKMTLVQEPVIFSNGKIYQNAALILSVDLKLHIGIENGWEKLEGPFVTTSSEKNVLKTLNYNNAFDTYKKYVETDSGKKFNKDNFFEISKSYPLGIIKFNKEVIVRDPIALDEDNNLILVGDIPQNSTINILKGNKENLINSSNKAILKIKNNMNENITKNVLIFDCISRSIFLEEKFSDELNQITKELSEDTNLFGALTLGEIANNGDEYLSFYNKTCVVGMLC